MITETRFSRTHQAFWRALLPMATDYVRRKNLTADVFDAPMKGSSSAHRGVVNETAFRVFAESTESAGPVRQLSDETVKSAEGAAVSFIRRFRAGSREVTSELSVEEREEARTLAGRLSGYFSSAGAALEVWPEIPGCGWLDSAQADVLVGDTLYEVKAGESAFGSHDLRQVLCYVAMGRAAGAPIVRSFELVNPRTGKVLRDTVARFCQAAGGAPYAQVIHELIDYVSQPLWEDEGIAR